MRTKISLHHQISIVLFAGVFSLMGIYTLTLYTIEKNNRQSEIDKHYSALLECYNSNLVTIKDYHRNGQSVLFFDNKVGQIIRNLFGKTKFKEKVYPFVLDSKGILLIHPFSEGADVSQSFWGAKILNSKESKGDFTFFSEEYKITNQIYYLHNSEFDITIGVIGENNIIYEDFFSFRRTIIMSFIILSLLCGFLIYYTSSYVVSPLNKLLKRLKQIENGNWENKYTDSSSLEFYKISETLSSIATSIENSVVFALNIAESKTNEADKITLDDSLLSDNLKKIEKNIETAIRREEQRRIEDDKLNWFNEGLAKFGEVLRLNTNSIEQQADNIIQNLVKYVKANQGGLFIISSRNAKTEYLELISAFAFDSKKYMEKHIEIGEGLVGTCAIEKQTVYIKQAPDSYIEITSGLGDSPPRSILIVPIKQEDRLLGVIELASFNYFEPHQIRFIEKIMESVAASLSSSKINQQTKELIGKFESQSKEMAEQEEEMRQTIEELTATQEEASSREAELNAVIQAISNSVNFIELDSDFKVQNLNQNFSQLFDLQYEATFGKSLNDLIMLNKAIFENPSEALRQLSLGEEIDEINTYQINQKKITIRDSYMPIKKFNGDVSKIIRIATVID